MGWHNTLGSGGWRGCILLGDGDRSLGVGGVEFDGECMVLSFTHSKHPHFQIQGRSMPITSNLLSEL